MADTWTWATVTQATPLRIKVDGDTTPLDATTDDLVGSLAVDDRVRVHLHSDGIIVTGIQGGGNRSNPNLLINSNFMVNQEGYVSGATVADGMYGFDGWKSRSPAGTVVTFTAAPQGQQVTIVSGSWAQMVERANIVAGTHTLSWKGTSQGLLANFGDGSDSFNSPVTVTLSGLADVLIQFGTGTLSDVKLERGTVATPYAPPTHADNLRACMRYYYRLTGFIGLFTAYSTTRFFCGMTFPVPMRAIPTSVASSATGITLTGSGTSATSTAIRFASATRDRLRIDVDGGSFPAGSAGWLDIAAGQWLAFDARL